MTMKTLTSRQFNQQTSQAKKAADEGPVFITHRGQRSYVLLKIDDYERLARNSESGSIIDRLAMPGAENVDFEPARLEGPLARDIDLS
jgi:prevent-host-death family protein